MMSNCNFRVGQKVVCINSRVTPDYHAKGLDYRGDLDGLRDGEVYTIREVFYCCLHQRVLVCLREIKRDISNRTRHEFGFEPRRFRPVAERKTDISVFKAMLNPSKEQVRA